MSLYPVSHAKPVSKGRLLGLSKMMAIALIALFGVSMIAESAEASGRRCPPRQRPCPSRRPPNTGERYSAAGSDDTNVIAQFGFFYATEEGELIEDEAPGNRRLGLFSGAIEGFESGLGRLPFTGSTNIIPGSFQPDNQLSFDVLNFSSALVNYDPALGTGELEYRIFQEDVDAFRPGVDPTILGFEILLSDAFSIQPDLDLDRAVNSLQYIVEQNLLGFGRNTAFSDVENFLPISEADLAETRDSGFAFVSSDDSNASVPEPGAVLGLSALGLLGASSLVKRQLKRS